VLNPRVLSLGIFTDENRVNIVVRGLESLYRHAGPDIREQVEGAAQC
jgi:hypothetical protein